jgi:hypothetical protein
MNPIAEDRVAWLADFRAQLVSNLEETQRQYKENANKHRKYQFNFKVEDQVWL